MNVLQGYESWNSHLNTRNFNTLFVILLPRQQDSFPTLYRRFDDTIPLNKDYVVPLRIVHTFLVNKVRANELMKIEGQ